MGLQLTQNYKGVDANYWKIINHQADHLENKTSCILALYKDQATRNENSSDYIYVEEVFGIDGSDLVRKDLYNAIKQTEKFQTAFDI